MPLGLLESMEDGERQRGGWLADRLCKDEWVRKEEVGESKLFLTAMKWRRRQEWGWKRERGRACQKRVWVVLVSDKKSFSKQRLKGLEDWQRDSRKRRKGWKESRMQTDRGRPMIQRGRAHAMYLSHIQFETVIPSLSVCPSLLLLSISLPRINSKCQINIQFHLSWLGHFKVSRSILHVRQLIQGRRSLKSWDCWFWRFPFENVTLLSSSVKPGFITLHFSLGSDFFQTFKTYKSGVVTHGWLLSERIFKTM